MAGELRLEMTAAPERIGPDEQLTIRLAAVNEGPDPADSRLRESRLFVDGEPSMTWSLAISNGTGDVRERELPPGERIEAARQFAASLLREPGDHELIAEVDGVRSNSVTVTLAGT